MERLRPAPEQDEDHDWLRIGCDMALEGEQPLWVDPVRHFRGSAAGDPCLRQLVLGAMGHEMPIEARKRRMFNVGLLIEREAVRTARNAGFLVAPLGEDDQPEVIYLDPPVVGHIDMICRSPSGAMVPVEVKSINGGLFRKLPKEHGPVPAGESPLLKAHARYVRQLNTYICAPNHDFGEGCMMFESKETHKQKFFWLRRDDEMATQMLDRLRPAAGYILSDPQRVPPRSVDPEPRGGTHKHCDRRYLCVRVPDEGADYDEVRRIDATMRG